MNKVVIPAAQAAVPKVLPVISTGNDCRLEGTVLRGKRADHELLRMRIKALWDECTPLWFKIKELFELLKTMESSPACDRFEYLQQLEECDKKYRANMQAYDAFVVGSSDADYG